MKSKRNLHNHPGLALLDTRRDFTSPNPAGPHPEGRGRRRLRRHRLCRQRAGERPPHLYPSIQMHNRGNGKGGGIAAVGLVPATWASPGRCWTTTTSSRSLCWIRGSRRGRGPVHHPAVSRWTTPGVSPRWTTGRTSGPGGPAAGRLALFRARQTGGLAAVLQQHKLDGLARARWRTSICTRTASS